jgi:hypothetical protein
MTSALCSCSRTSHENVYQAPLPDGERSEDTRPSCMQKVGSALTRAALYLAFKVCCRCRFGKRTKENFFKDRNFKELWIKTHDDVLLHGAIKRGTVKKALLLVVGLGDRFESIADSKSYAYGVKKFAEKKLADWTFMTINVRGRGHSKGHYVPKDFGKDVYAAFQFLVQKEGFKPDDVLPVGHSLGGYAVIRGAATMQKMNPNSKISVFVDRAFLFLEKVVTARFGTGCLGKCVWRTTNTFGWHVDNLDAHQLKGKIIALVSKYDAAVPYATSFDKITDLKNLQVVEINFPNEEQMDTHAEAYTEEHEEAVYKLIHEVFLKKDETKDGDEALSAHSIEFDISDRKA